jgi:hypothetical protein
MANTVNLDISLVASNQAQKEVTVNTAISTIDAILNRGAIDRALNTPATSPAEGDLYILGTTPTGAWSGHANDVAYYQTTWKFINPNEGLTVWVNDENMQYSWDGAAWVSTISSSLDNLTGVGINTTHDATNKLAVKSDAVLFDHNGTSSQLKVNKNAAGNTASHLFQTGFSGRAEFGLIGDDDFQVKVSSDGATWYQSYVITKSTGDIEFKKNVSCADNLFIRPELKDYSETKTSPSSSSGTLTLNLENGNVFEVTQTENITTANFTNPPATGKAGSFKLILKQDATGGRTFAWPASVKWAGGVAPSLTTTSNAVNILNFITVDAGTKWYGFLMGADMR